jgi:hypothetical protein
LNETIDVLMDKGLLTIYIGVCAMKNPRAYGIVLLASAVLLVLIPWLLFPVCGVGRYASESMGPVNAHGCYKTLIAETILAVVMVLVSAAAIFAPRRNVIRLASAFAVIAAAFAVLFPSTITGICKMQTMPCVYGTYPALIVSAVLMACAGAYSFFGSGKVK